MNHVIEEQFNKVRETYFPQWDRKRVWQLSTSDSDAGSCRGICYSNTKTVVIPERSLMGDEVYLRQLIIHEIAHAVTNLGHGTGWRHRIEQAALKAEALNEIEIAKGLRDEIKWYSNRDNEPLKPVSMSYHHIKILVFDNPDRSFEDIANELSDNMSHEEFCKKLKRSQKVYEQAKKFRAKFASAEEAWQEWLKKNRRPIELEEELL